jgi:hypothetical protein
MGSQWLTAWTTLLTYLKKGRKLSLPSANLIKIIVMCTGVHVTKNDGSSSDHWILLALRLQPLLITLSHHTTTIPHILQTLLTLIFAVVIYIHNSLIAPSHTTLHWQAALNYSTNKFFIASPIHDCLTTLHWTNYTSYRPSLHNLHTDRIEITSSHLFTIVAGIRCLASMTFPYCCTLWGGR